MFGKGSFRFCFLAARCSLLQPSRAAGVQPCCSSSVYGFLWFLRIFCRVCGFSVAFTDFLWFSVSFVTFHPDTFYSSCSVELFCRTAVQGVQKLRGFSIWDFSAITNETDWDVHTRFLLPFHRPSTDFYVVGCSVN